MKIGELANATATNVETVRYYEKIGLLAPPARSASNYRSYGNEHLARLSFIRRARDLGFTLEAVRELLTLRMTLAKVAKQWTRLPAHTWPKSNARSMTFRLYEAS